MKMRSQKRPWSLPLWGFALVFFTITVFSNRQQTDEIKQRYLVPPPEQIEHFHFGFSETVADSLWLRWIQDIGHCQTYSGGEKSVQVAEADKAIEPTDPMIKNPRHKNCDVSWGFKMIDAITRLAPRFRMPYLAGAVTLSVIVEDYKGTSVIFERALARFPNDFEIAYRASYHFLYDRNDVERAAQLMSLAADNGGPFWLKSLSSKLFTKIGKLELGIATLEEHQKNPLIRGSPEILKEVEARLANLKQEMVKAQGEVPEVGSQKDIRKKHP